MPNDEQINALIARFGDGFLRYRTLLLLVVGLVLIALGYVMGGRQLGLLLNGQRASGQIVDFKQELFRTSDNQSHSSTGMMPIVEFQLDDQTIRFQDWLGSSRSKGLNTAVTVLYDQARPTNAMIDRKIMNWMPWAPIVLVGLLLTLSAVRKMTRSKN